jgi:hypothetical protein
MDGLAGVDGPYLRLWKALHTNLRRNPSQNIWGQDSLIDLSVSVLSSGTRFLPAG